MAQLKENGICRIFYSSPFNGMEGEREDLTRRYWPQIQALCNSRGVQFVPVDMRWGITTELSDNNQTINICLKQIDRSDLFVGFYGQRYGWHGEKDEVLQRSFDAALANFPWIEQHRGKSVTELEFLYGHLNHPGKIPSVICFRNKAWDDKHREEGKAQGNKKMVYKYSSESEHATDLLDDLKARVKGTEDKLLALSMSYDTPEEGARLMSETVLDYLDKILLKKSNTMQMSLRQQELEEHDAFCMTRTTFYIQPKDQLSLLNSHVSKDSGGVVLVTGTSGSGKTAFLSSWLQSLREQQHENTVLAYHFVGSSQASSDALNILARLCKEVLISVNNLSDKEADSAVEQFCADQDTSQGVRLLKRALNEARTKEKRVIIIVDGLDKIKLQMKTTKHLFWLPEPIPEGVYFVLATETSDTDRIDSLRETWSGQLEQLDIQPLDLGSQKLLCQEGLKLRGKELSPAQMEVVLNSEGAKNPLFLKIVLEELCMFGKFRELDQKIQSLVSCSSSEELFHLYLERMESDYSSSEYPANLVEDVMCTLYVSRHGLNEAEVMAALNIASHLWSPVYFGMQHYITSRQGFISFGYEDLKKAVFKRYIKSDDNRLKYFRKLKDHYYNVLIVQGDGLEKFRLTVELLHIAYMSGDQVLVWRLITAPSTLSALVKTAARSELLQYIQGMDIGQEEIIHLYFKEFKYHMVKSYCNQMEDLIAEPNVVKEFVQNLEILYEFLLFAHYHTAGEKVLLKILEVQEKNPDMFKDNIETVAKLACHYLDMKLPEKSLPLQEKCVRVGEKRQESGKEEDQSFLATSCHGLGLAYLGLKKTKLAREYFAKSMALHKKTPSEQYPSLSATAQTLCDDGDYEESLKVYEEVREMEEELYFGELSIHTSYTLTNMAIVCRKLRRFEEAEKHYKKALHIKQTVYQGMQHFDIAIAYTNLGNLALDRDDYQKAEENFTEAHQMLELDGDKSLISSANNPQAVSPPFNPEAASAITMESAPDLGMAKEPTAILIKDNLLLTMANQSKFDDMFPLYWPDFYKLLLDANWFDNSHAVVHFTMAQVLAFRHGKPEESCEILGRLVQTSKASTDHFLFLNGIATDMLSRGREAPPLPYEQSLERCFELFPDFMPAREQKVQKQLIPKQDTEEIIQTIEGYYSHVGYADDTLVVLCSQHCEEAGWPEGIIKLYQHFRPKFPNSEAILRNLAAIYAQQGHLMKSMQCFEELTQKSPGVWMFFDKIVTLKFSLEDYSGARQSVEVLAQNFPQEEEVQEKVKKYRDVLDEIDQHLAQSNTSENNDAENEG